MFFDNEERIKNINNERNKYIEEAMELYGHKTCDSSFLNTDDYQNLNLDFVKNNKLIVRNFDLKPRSTKFIRSQANKILVNQTGSLDRKLLYISDDEKVVYDYIAKYGEVDEASFNHFVEYLKNYAKKIEVTKIPILWYRDNYRNARSCIYSLFSDKIPDCRKKFPIISTKIVMSNQNDDLAISVLVHEMVHALVDRNKGIVENIFHDEVLSIYFEFVAAYEADPTGKLLNVAQLNRLQYLKMPILQRNLQVFNGEIPTDDNYIISSLYAFDLFEKYRQASNKVRNSINQELNKTFSGKRTLESTLERLDVSEKAGCEIIRDKVKTLMK